MRPERPRRGLRRGLLGFLVISLAVAMFVISAAVYLFTSRHERSAWRDRQAESAEHAVVTLNAFVERSKDAIVLIGLLDETAVRDPEVLRRFVDNNPAMLEVVRVSRDGDVVASAHQYAPLLANLFTLQQSAWFVRARAGEPFVSNLEISSLNEPYLILAVPTPSGGVVAARLSATVLWEVVRGLKFGETGRAYLINSMGRVIAHPDPEVVTAWTSVRDRPEVEAMLGAPSRRWSGTYESFMGDEVEGLSAAIRGTDWTVVTELPATEATASSRAALMILDSSITFFGVAVAIAAAMWMQRVIFRPMEALRRGAERIGNGELEHHIVVDRQDEVGEVAEAFNSMATRLAAREAQLAEQAAELAVAVGARERAAEGMRVAKEAAESASRAKSQFLANMSHEIRTPINGISGMNELMLAKTLDGEQRGHALRIRESVDALARLIDDVLDFSRIEAGYLHFEAVGLDVRAEVGRVMDTFSAAASQKGVQLTWEAGPAVPARVVGDPFRIRQVLTNLVGNALKFTEKGTIKVDVSWRGEEDGVVNLRFDVSDTGIGIPDAMQTTIFDPFTQVDGSMSRRFGGAGLGLSICRQLVERMGGGMGVSSAVGEGSTFWFCLRLPRAAVDEDVVGLGFDGREGVASARHTRPPNLGGRVLLVEDNRLNREVMVGLLDTLGVAVDTAKDGREAVAAWRAGEYDVILMDCQMPDMDGYEATALIRDGEQARGAGAHRTPIIAITANTLEGDRDRSLSIGMDDHLAKPFRLHQLADVLRRWMEPAPTAPTFRSAVDSVRSSSPAGGAA